MLFRFPEYLQVKKTAHKAKISLTSFFLIINNLNLNEMENLNYFSFLKIIKILIRGMQEVVNKKQLVICFFIVKINPKV